MPVSIRSHVIYPTAPARIPVPRVYSRGRPWSDQDYKILETRWGKEPSANIAAYLNRTVQAVNHMASIRKLTP